MEPCISPKYLYIYFLWNGIWLRTHSVFEKPWLRFPDLTSEQSFIYVTEIM